MRVAAAQCLAALASNSNIIQTTDMDGTVAAAVKAFEVRRAAAGALRNVSQESDYPTRRAVAEFLGLLLASTQDIEQGRPAVRAARRLNVRSSRCRPKAVAAGHAQLARAVARPARQYL